MGSDERRTVDNGGAGGGLYRRVRAGGGGVGVGGVLVRWQKGAMMQLADVVGVALWSTKRGAQDEQVATLTGELDAARRECAELRERVAGLEARLNQAIDDKLNYYQLFIDATNNLSKWKGGR
jgi:hypothetical protein